MFAWIRSLVSRRSRHRVTPPVPHLIVERRTFAATDYEAERARAIADAFRTGHIIVGKVREEDVDLAYWHDALEREIDFGLKILHDTEATKTGEGDEAR